MADPRLQAVYEAQPGAVRRTFWMGYAVTPHSDGIKIEGQPPMSIVEARRFMHSVVDLGCDDLIKRFGY